MRLPLALTATLLAIATPLVAFDLPKIQQRGRLRVLAVGVDDEPELFALAPGVPPGFDHERVQGFARLQRLGLQPVRVETWRALQVLRSSR